jgi:hypothetical protein
MENDMSQTWMAFLLGCVVIAVVILAVIVL